MILENQSINVSIEFQINQQQRNLHIEAIGHLDKAPTKSQEKHFNQLVNILQFVIHYHSKGLWTLD